MVVKIMAHYITAPIIKATQKETIILTTAPVACFWGGWLVVSEAGVQKMRGTNLM